MQEETFSKTKRKAEMLELQALGARLVDLPEAQLASMQLAPELGEERFSSDEKRRRNGDELSELIAKIMKTRSASDWLRLCEENDVPVDLCVTPADAAQHPQLVERRAVERGYAKFPVWANGRRGGAIRAPTPKLGEHSREILVELGFDDAEIAALVRTGVVNCA